MSPPSPPDKPFGHELGAEGLRRASWRIGSTPYLNTLPLVYGLEREVTYCVPAEAADRMHRGELDASVLPVAEVLRHDQYDIVDGLAIASAGPVFSVFMTHDVPIERLTRVGVDTASRTSAWLVRVILKYGYHVEPEFYPCPATAPGAQHEARVMIGDPAIRHRLGTGAGPVLDLGEAWLELTGLPFVFAVWALQRTLAGKAALCERLRRAKADGLAHREAIVQDTREFTAEFRREYLTRYVSFDLGEREKQGLRRFQRYLYEMKLIESCHDLRYIT